jgi:hypothetical protein
VPVSFHDVIGDLDGLFAIVYRDANVPDDGRTWSQL